jgi:hypothetical protein
LQLFDSDKRSSNLTPRPVDPIIGLCSLFEQPLLKANLAAPSLIGRAAAFSNGRLEDDAAALIARFT